MFACSSSFFLLLHIVGSTLLNKKNTYRKITLIKQKGIYKGKNMQKIK